MSTKPKFCMPVIAPPDDATAPAVYYASLGINLSVDPFGTDGALQITMPGPAKAPPAGQEPLTTVYATTAGFVTFYPSDAHSTPDGLPINIAPDLSGPDLCTIVLRIWAPHTAGLSKREPPEQRPTHLVHTGLRRASVEKTFKAEMETRKVSRKVLTRSWKETGGTGKPDRPILEAAFLKRVLAGDAALYVSSGTALGTMAVQPGTTVEAGQMLLQAYAVPASSPPKSASVESLTYDVARLPAFNGHPLSGSLDKIEDITFKCTFELWNKNTRLYEILSSKTVTLHRRLSNTSNQKLSSTTTDGDGVATLVIPISRRADIYFVVDVSSKLELTTDVHRVFIHLHNAIFKKHYKLKYEIFPKYEEFVSELRKNKNEKYDKDRGETTGRWLVPLVDGPLMKNIKEFEDAYSKRPRTEQFNVLIEGDSWTHYPVQHTDMFNALDALISDNMPVDTNGRPTKSYNKITLQHFGDRTDQMFSTPTEKVKQKQWTFTKSFLDEYHIDLIVLSAGGCDFAEPGIDHDAEGPFKKTMFSDGCFDPFGPPWEDLPELHQETAIRLMDMSFSILLKNHPWNVFRTKGAQLKDEKAYAKLLLDKLSDIEQEIKEKTKKDKAFGEKGDSRTTTAEKVIRNFPDVRFPPDAADVYSLLLGEIFDATRFGARQRSAKQNMKVIADYAATKSIPVVCHTYCYPLFSERGTPLLSSDDLIVTGPWLNRRLEQAGVTDQRIRMIVLKSLIDNFVRSVLEPLKGQHFDYVDLRTFGLEEEKKAVGSFWHDEMHLTSKGYALVAEEMFRLIKAKFPSGFFKA